MSESFFSTTGRGAGATYPPRPLTIAHNSLDARLACITGSDIDGTLLDYGHVRSTPHFLNLALCEKLAGQPLHLITNQEDMATADGPTIAEFMERLTFLEQGLAQANIEIASLRVCVYHSNVSLEHCRKVARELHAALRWPQRYLAVVYDHASYRRIQSCMLSVAGVKVFYGAEEYDLKAVKVIGAMFVQVERFTG